jgi:hypothetical protein
MYQGKFTKLRKTALLLALNLLSLPFLVAGMQSQTYQINADTINSGGNLSGSANYHAGDTLGEAATGEERSANYKSKTAFWYMFPEGSQLGLSCEASDVYMMDYTLGNANDYSKYIFSTSQECVITDNSSAPWSLTMQSTNMTSANNVLSNSNVKLSTDDNVSSGDTITSPTSGIDEASTSDWPLDAPKTVIQGDVTADGSYNNRPTMKLTNLNSLFAETISGTLTITIQ